MINLALIGNGKWGKNYVKEIAKISNVQIKYIRTYDYLNLVNKNDINGIIIATPDKTHYKIINTFPNEYILVEKPVVTSLKELLEIKNDKIVAGHTYLYNIALVNFFKDLSNIKTVDFIIRNTESVKNTTPLWHLGIHGIALFVFLWGEPESIRVKKINDNLFIELDYQFNKTPFIVRIEAGWNYSEKERIIKVEGLESLIFDDSNTQEVSPLENECREFINFIQGKPSISGLEHIKKVTKITQQIEDLIR